jgi:predicted XRE-type DNA-binding protein
VFGSGSGVWLTAFVRSSNAIYAGVSAGYPRIEDLDPRLAKSMFEREPITNEAAFLAGQAFLIYQRRGGAMRSPLPDFLVGPAPRSPVISCCPPMLLTIEPTLRSSCQTHQIALALKQGHEGVGIQKDNRLMIENTAVTPSSGNLFADLGLKHPQAELLTARLVGEGHAAVKRRKPTQTKAADLTGVKLPDVSAIVAGRTGKLSLDHLMRCLNRFDCEVDVVVVRHKPAKARGRQRAAA